MEKNTQLELPTSSNRLDAIENSSQPEKQEKTELGLIGFICPFSDQPCSFDYCITKCEKHCLPLPLLLALIEEKRVTPMRYSITELLNPPQIIYYSRNKPYYERPKNLVWRTFGSAWHALLEKQKGKIKELGLEKDYEIEEKSFAVEVKTDVGTITITGKPDMYIVPQKSLWDFKTTKYYYTVANLKDGKWEDNNYAMQINAYRVFKYPEAKEMKLFVLVKDWNRMLYMKYGCEPVEEFDVPFIDSSEVMETLISSAENAVKCQENPDLIRPCTEEEKWVHAKTKNPLRCFDYCIAKEHCPQFAEYMAKHGG